MNNKALEMRLKESMGYVGEQDLLQMIQELGMDFPVVALDNTRNRKWVTLGDLTTIDTTDLRSVFLSSQQYDKMFGKPILTTAGYKGNEEPELTVTII